MHRRRRVGDAVIEEAEAGSDDGAAGGARGPGEAGAGERLLVSVRMASRNWRS